MSTLLDLPSATAIGPSAVAVRVNYPALLRCGAAASAAVDPADPGTHDNHPIASIAIETLIAQLLRDGQLALQGCTLVRNEVCDCIVGTDAAGTDAVAALSASPAGCRTAIHWALRAPRNGPPATPWR